MKKHKQLTRLAVLTAVTFISTAVIGEERRCYIKDGDRWAFYGDSITDAGVYAKAVERVFRHFHPNAKVTFINNGIGGKSAARATAKEALRKNPNIVSIMLGMNDAINSKWGKGMPVKPVIEAYRANMTRLVRNLKAAGKEVVLMTPTLTDETISTSIFRLAGTEALLRQMGQVCEDIAKAEKIPCLPVQQDFSRFQQRQSLAQERLRYDGVHPTAVGQYEIARIMWRRLNLAAPLSQGSRKLYPPMAELPLAAKAEQRILPCSNRNIKVIFNTEKPLHATLSWSLAGKSGKTKLKIAKDTCWTLPAPEILPSTDGTGALGVIDAEDSKKRSIFLLDILRNPLLHMKNNQASGQIKADGKVICNYLFRKDGRGLYFKAGVIDDELSPRRNRNAWPWNGDNVTLYLDLRPNARFGGSGMERDVFQVWFQPQTKYGYSPGFRIWYGKGLEHAGVPFGQKTADGYEVALLIDGYFSMQERFDINKRDFIGFDMSVCDYSAAAKKSKWHSLKKTQYPPFLYASGFTVVDLKNKLKDNSIYTVNIFPGSNQ